MRLGTIAGVVLLVLFVALLGALPLKGSFAPVHGFVLASAHWVAVHWIGLVQTLLMLIAIGLVFWLIGRLNLIWRTHHAFNHQFEKLRRFYGGLLAYALSHASLIVGAFTVLVIISLGLILMIGRDFFPSVDAGQLRLHVRCPPGTRIEQSSRYFQQVEQEIRKHIPGNEIVTMLDNIGIPNSSINLSLSDGSLMSAADGEILIALGEDHHSTGGYQRTLRKELPKAFPNLTFFFAPADIVTQVLNFGLQAPIDIQIAGPDWNTEKNDEIARAMIREIQGLPGVVDIRMQQVPRQPDMYVSVDRTLASQVGVLQRDVASDLLVSLSSSNQTQPNFWLDPHSGVDYSIFVQTPQYRMDSMNELENTPVVPTNAVATPENTQLLTNLATFHRQVTPANITHNQTLNTRDVLMAVDGTDLKSAADEISRVMDQYRPQLPRGSKMDLRGQIQSMNSSFNGLAGGLVFAVVLVYLLMVINFQSWVDPLIILMALPGALAGILWMLWATGTPLSVPRAHGRDHEHRRGDGQLDPDDHLRQRSTT